MRRLATGIAAVAVLTMLACVHNPVWSAAEMEEWYAAATAGTSDPFFDGLHYQGSDEHYHYFMFRGLDSWFFPRVPRGQVELPDQRTYKSGSGVSPYGYYEIDPLDNWNPVAKE